MKNFGASSTASAPATKFAGAGFAAIPGIAKTNAPMLSPAPRYPRRGVLFETLQLFQHVIGAGDGERPGLFDVELRDHTVVCDEREPLAALAHPELRRIHFEAQGAGEIPVAVR